jgi:GPI mannosyltransferase 1 subunit M
MKGDNTFLPLWVAGLLFFAVNVGLLATLMQHHLYAPLFQGGRVVQLVSEPANEKCE